jgi:hypothetical protein
VNLFHLAQIRVQWWDFFLNIIINQVPQKWGISLHTEELLAFQTDLAPSHLFVSKVKL